MTDNNIETQPHADNPNRCDRNRDRAAELAELVEFIELLNESSHGSPTARAACATAIQAVAAAPTGTTSGLVDVDETDLVVLEAELVTAERFAAQGDHEAAQLARRSVLAAPTTQQTWPLQNRAAAHLADAARVLWLARAIHAGIVVATQQLADLVGERVRYLLTQPSLITPRHPQLDSIQTLLPFAAFGVTDALLQAFLHDWIGEASIQVVLDDSLIRGLIARELARRYTSETNPGAPWRSSVIVVVGDHGRVPSAVLQGEVSHILFEAGRDLFVTAHGQAVSPPEGLPPDECLPRTWTCSYESPLPNVQDWLAQAHFEAKLHRPGRLPVIRSACQAEAVPGDFVQRWLDCEAVSSRRYRQWVTASLVDHAAHAPSAHWLPMHLQIMWAGPGSGIDQPAKIATLTGGLPGTSIHRDDPCCRNYLLQQARLIQMLKCWIRHSGGYDDYLLDVDAHQRMLECSRCGSVLSGNASLSPTTLCWPDALNAHPQVGSPEQQLVVPEGFTLDPAMLILPPLPNLNDLTIKQETYAATPQATQREELCGTAL